MSQQAVVLAREQVDVAGRALTAKAREASTGAAMVGGGALLAALASGTGTAALILLLSRRPGASAAALGVTGAYAGAAAILAREGLVRLREAGLSVPDEPARDVPVQNAKQDRGSAKRRTESAAKSTLSSTKTAAKSPRGAKTAAKSPRDIKTAAKSPRRTKSAAKSTPKPKLGSPDSRRRASPSRTGRTRQSS